MLEHPTPHRLESNHLAALRVDDLVRTAPIVSVASAFAALVLGIVLIDGTNAVAGAVWLALAIAVNVARLFLTQTVDPGESEAVRARHLWRGFQACGHANAVVLGAGLPLLLADANWLQAGIAFLAMGGVLGALLGSGRAAPQVNRSLVLAITAGAIAASWLIGGLAVLPIAVVLVAQAGILLRVVAAQDAFFLERARREYGRRESDATVRLLLGDYEQHSSDWLWTTDRGGHLQAVSDRFAEVAGKGASALDGRPLVAMFDEGSERERLAAALDRREPFRDLVVPLRIDGVRRYWSLSGRPHEDGRISGFARDVTEARLSQDRIRQMAHFDGLTGLANRNLLTSSLREAAKTGEAGDDARTIALLYLDLDDFKTINDTQGHGFGDRLLREVAERLVGCVRDRDTVARLGGDEFAILIAGEMADRALAQRAEAVLEALRRPIEIGEQDVRITASLGIARCRAGECDGEELLRRADLALYAAKARGRDGFALYESSLDEAVRERRRLELDLRQALERDQLEVHYQSIIDLDRGQVLGHEALLRWNHPTRGLVTPDEFIPIAEETGLIVPIGEWVIRRALHEAGSWNGGNQIAINLSPVQIRSPNLVQAVRQALDSSGIAARRVTFEITEGALLRNSEANRAVLLKLREMGIRIALDDFGTGYSSLGYLRSFPFDRIKIDRSFVADVVEQADSQAIIAAVTRLAAALGMRTTAEGVERIEQLDMLRTLGCNEAQGFLIARPVAAADLEEEEAQLALPTPLPAEIIDYRKARRAAAQRRQSGSTSEDGGEARVRSQ